MYLTSEKLRGKRCAVVGGAGFIGSHIVDAALHSGADHVVVYDNFCRGTQANLASALRTGRVTIEEGDIRDSAELSRALTGCSYVFHQAAVHLRRCEHNPREALEINELGSFNVTEACVKSGVRKLIAASSSSVYGEGEQYPTDEKHPFLTRLFYGAGKVGAEQYYRAFRNKYGISFVALRYLNVYGPRQDAKGAYTEVVMSFLNTIEKGERPVIHGDGRQTLDLVFVRDAADANLLALDSAIDEGFFNVASGRETTVLELFRLLCRLRGVSVEPIFAPDDLSLVPRRFGCPREALARLGFRARTKLEDGLQEVIKWRRSAAVEEDSQNDIG